MTTKDFALSEKPDGRSIIRKVDENGKVTKVPGPDPAKKA